MVAWEGDPGEACWRDIAANADPPPAQIEPGGVVNGGRMGKVSTIKNVDVSKLIPYINNAKQHSEDQITRIASSIREFGFLSPVLIDHEYNIIAGHGRVLAAKKLGLNDVPCVYVEGLSDAQRKAYILADNRLGELADWDMELVTSELETLLESNFDIDLTGFELPEDDDSPYEAHDDDYEPMVAETPRVKSGEIWVLGNHRLMCGDSASAEDVKKLFGGVLADMVFTDPPYGVAIGDKNKMLDEVGKSGCVKTNIEGDTLSTDDLYQMLLSAFTNLRENCAEDCSYYVTSPQGGEIGLMMMMMMRDAGLQVRHNLIWEKSSATFSMGRLDYDYKHEPIFYTWTKRHNFYGKGQYRNTVWQFPKPHKCDLHPTMKPVELVAECLLNSSKEGDYVADIFGGSGTTIIACEQLKRNCIMMEKDPHYADVIIDRWEQFTGEKAVLLNG